jgi:hypothetical protein
MEEIGIPQEGYSIGANLEKMPTYYLHRSNNILKIIFPGGKKKKNSVSGSSSSRYRSVGTIFDPL